MNTTPIQDLRDEAFKKIIKNDVKKKKWFKASRWLKEQMIIWELEKN
ncbi:hypothetical protein [Flammeovirga pectinis]|nr:hypothetical protein [Flammeovirga pectinis]